MTNAEARCVTDDVVVDRFYIALFSALEQTHNDDVELNVLGCRVDVIIKDKL